MDGLSKRFSDKSYPVKRLPAKNSRKSRGWRKMAQTHAVSFSWFATERFIRSDCTQKENCRAFHKLSTDIKLYDTLPRKMNEMARSMKRQRSSISGRKLMKTRKFCGKQILGVLEKQYDLWDLTIDWNAAKKKIVKEKKKICPRWPHRTKMAAHFRGKFFRHQRLEIC